MCQGVETIVDHSKRVAQDFLAVISTRQTGKLVVMRVLSAGR